MKTSHPISVGRGGGTGVGEYFVYRFCCLVFPIRELMAVVVTAVHSDNNPGGPKQPLAMAACC